jgi:hypothetical protein
MMNHKPPSSNAASHPLGDSVAFSAADGAESSVVSSTPAPLALSAPQVEEAAFDGLWEAISAQLDKDDVTLQAQSVASTSPQPVWDATWASTYMDEELTNDQERLLFEVAMSHDPQLAQWVEQAQAVSDTIRQYAYRLETNCAELDCAPAVMRQLALEPDDTPALVGASASRTTHELSASDLELLGHWHDEQPMEPAQTAYVQALLNHHDDVRQRVDGLGLLGAILAEYQHRLEANAPSLDELTCKRLVRQAPPSLFGSIKLWQGAQVAVASVVIAFIGFNVMSFVDARTQGSPPVAFSVENSAAGDGVVVRGAQTAAHGADPGWLARANHPAAGMDIEPGASSGWAPGGPDGPYDNGPEGAGHSGGSASGLSGEAGAEQAPTLADEPPPTAEEYLMQLQDQQYTVNEYEMSVEL